MNDKAHQYRIEFELPDGYRVATGYVGVRGVAYSLASDIRKSADEGTLKIHVTSRVKEAIRG